MEEKIEMPVSGTERVYYSFLKISFFNMKAFPTLHSLNFQLWPTNIIKTTPGWYPDITMRCCPFCW